MKTRIAANIALHAVAGLCSFFPFWLTAYGTYERNGRGSFELAAWMPLILIGLGCAIAAFVISFIGSRYICIGFTRWPAAFAFSLGFLLSTFASLANWGNEDGQWKVSVVGMPITIAIFVLSFWGGTVGSRIEAHPVQ